MKAFHAARRRHVPYSPLTKGVAQSDSGREAPGVVRLAFLNPLRQPPEGATTT
jgi:hypothetical protein